MHFLGSCFPSANSKYNTLTSHNKDITIGIIPIFTWKKEDYFDI